MPKFLVTMTAVIEADDVGTVEGFVQDTAWYDADGDDYPFDVESIVEIEDV